MGGECSIIPRDSSLDSSLALLKEGYLFLQNWTKKFKSDIFGLRLMARNVICISGKEAVALFYDTQKFERQNAVPKRVQKTEQLNYAANSWQAQKTIQLYAQAKQILCRSACIWAGMPLQNSEAGRRADDLSELVSSFGSIGPKYFKGKIARGRTEDWAKAIIQDVRKGAIKPPKDSPLYKIACHIDQNGNLLDVQMAAVELINILRPIVAIATYIAFSALALHENPECKIKLKNTRDNYLDMFVQEVRRYYPFTPFFGCEGKTGLYLEAVRL